MRYKIFALGDNALTIEFGNQISVKLNNIVLKLARFFEQNPFAGLIESVPAYASLTIFYNVSIVRKQFPKFSTAFEAVRHIAEIALQNNESFRPENSRVVKIPVCFVEEFAPDLEYVASSNNLSPDAVIEIFLARSYRVFMMGFLPGFSYMGEVDRRIAAPRKSTPRLLVPQGSVGIAGKQTGVYSLASPGGWQIIGKTNEKLFTPTAKNPTFLQTGDTVRFYQTTF